GTVALFSAITNTTKMNLGIFRSQFYLGAIASFMFAATQLWSANLFYLNGTLYLHFSARGADPVGFLAFTAS
ncbi:hypothetical protein PMAYCL1PPCAC_15921, partial [Pristionchus mayeri]